MAPPILKRRKIRNKNLLALSTALTTTVATLYYHTNFDKIIQHNSKLRGKEWMKELLSGHSTRIKDNLGVTQEGFLYLEDLLIRKGSLQSTRYMGTSEQLGIFLYAVVTDLSIRKLAERFQRSTEIIQRTYHKVMRHFLSTPLYESIIQPATASTPTANNITCNHLYFPSLRTV
jgi:hypothetical protein